MPHQVGRLKFFFLFYQDNAEMSHTAVKSGKLRRFLWPIHRHELKKLIPMLIMAFCIAFAYSVLRNMKDSLLVTAASSGAEVIPFVKVWAMLPMAILLTSVFVKLSHHYSTERVFYIMMSGFLAFFCLFTFVLYPHRDLIHPHGLADRLELLLPGGCRGFITMIRYWSFSLFYAMSELWGVINLTVLFWGFANEVTLVEEAKRFYAFVALGSNLSSIVAGQASRIFCQHAYNPSWGLGEDAWHQSLILLTVSILSAGIIAIMTFRWLQKHVISKMEAQEKRPNKQLRKLESKPSMRKSFAYLLGSRYLLCVALVVVSYNLFINLVEVLWKAQVKELYPNPNEFNAYMGGITSVTGIVATIMGIFIQGNLIQRFGWTIGALVTPMILVVTSLGFFGSYFFSDHLVGITGTFLGLTPLWLTVWFGSAQNCLSRASKYTVFDATKELCFIPLDRDSRVKGKAAIDGVASRLGKSGSSLIYQFLFVIFGQLSRAAPYVAGLLFGVLFVWMSAVKRLGRRFDALVAEGKAKATPEGEEAAPRAKPVLAKEILAGERQAI